MMDQITKYIGTVAMPQMAPTLFPDLIDVLSLTTGSDGAGGVSKTAQPTKYESIPALISPIERHESLDTLSSKMLSQERYTVTMPTYATDGTRIDLNPVAHRFKVLARGSEPEKILRIIAIANVSGMAFTVQCVREN